MSITEIIQSEVAKIPAGQIFGYQKFSNYTQSSAAVIKAICRMVSNNKIKRISKGKFYVAKEGIFGLRKPSDDELIRSILYKTERLCGYVTGHSIYNQLGLTTQIPCAITIAYNGGRQEKNLGTIRVKTIVTRIPIEENNVKLLQYLDILKDLKKIPDADINISLKIMHKYFSKLTLNEQQQLLELVKNYYTPQAKALVCFLFSNLNFNLPSSLSLSLNPTTSYKLNLDHNIWPLAKDWNIQ